MSWAKRGYRAPESPKNPMDTRQPSALRQTSGHVVRVAADCRRGQCRQAWDATKVLTEPNDPRGPKIERPDTNPNNVTVTFQHGRIWLYRRQSRAPGHPNPKVDQRGVAEQVRQLSVAPASSSANGLRETHRIASAAVRQRFRRSGYPTSTPTHLHRLFTHNSHYPSYSTHDEYPS
jgi:hypothetical protein